MKSILSILIAMVFTSTLFGQNVIEERFTDYKEQENFTSVHITSKMFELANYIEVEDENKELQELKDFVSTIYEFNLIAGREVPNVKSAYDNAVSRVENDFEELMHVDDKQERFTFMIDEKGGIVNEIIMVGNTDEELIIFSLTGEMDLRQMSRMANKIQAQGFSHMEMLKDNGAGEVKVYPNPSNGSSLTVKIPNQMIGGSANLYNMKGEAVRNFRIESEEQDINVYEMPNGKYVLELQKDGVTIKQKVIIQSK